MRSDADLPLFGTNDDPARYAGAAIPGRIGAHVVGTLVHDRGALGQIARVGSPCRARPSWG